MDSICTACSDPFCLLLHLKCEHHEDSAAASTKFGLRNGRWAGFDALPWFDEGRERKRKGEERLNVICRALGTLAFSDMKLFLMDL